MTMIMERMLSEKMIADEKAEVEASSADNESEDAYEVTVQPSGRKLSSSIACNVPTQTQYTCRQRLKWCENGCLFVSQI